MSERGGRRECNMHSVQQLAGYLLALRNFLLFSLVKHLHTDFQPHISLMVQCVGLLDRGYNINWHIYFVVLSNVSSML